MNHHHHRWRAEERERPTAVITAAIVTTTHPRVLNRSLVAWDALGRLMKGCGGSYRTGGESRRWMICCCTNFYVLVEFELEQGRKPKKGAFHFSLLPRGTISILIRCTYLHTPKYARHWHSFSKTKWTNWPFCLWWPFRPRCFIFHSFSSHKKISSLHAPPHTSQSQG